MLAQHSQVTRNFGEYASEQLVQAPLASHPKDDTSELNLRAHRLQGGGYWYSKKASS
jgi:hypothetical protein